MIDLIPQSILASLRYLHSVLAEHENGPLNSEQGTAALAHLTQAILLLEVIPHAVDRTR